MIGAGSAQGLKQPPSAARLPILAALALAVGLIFSFPHWWWYFTSPDYTVLPGYLMADDDMAPYTAALNTSADGLPPVTAYHPSYETRDLFQYASLSNWLTNLLLGNLLRLAGSFELFVPLALLFSGAATFLLIHSLAHRLVNHFAAAVLAALLACFRYPFYASLVAVARQFVQSGWQLSASEFVRLAFPGLVAGNQLYPYVRWPVPGMMFWWFLIALILVFRLARTAWLDRLATGSSTRQMLATGVWIGLSAYVYFFFWSYLMPLLALLALIGLFSRRRLFRAMAGSFACAAIISAPFWLLASGLVMLPNASQLATLSSLVGGQGQSLMAEACGFTRCGDVDNFLRVLSTHGLLAVMVLLTSLPALRVDRKAVGLFSMHLLVVALASLELMGGQRLQSWHWPRHMLDLLMPVTAVWLFIEYRPHTAGDGSAWRPVRAVAGIAGLIVILAVFGLISQAATPGNIELVDVLRSWVAFPALVLMTLWLRYPARQVLIVAAVAVSAGAWLLYHRTITELSWVAFLPLVLWLAAHRPRLAATVGAGFIVLNVVLAIALQMFVRPVIARPFFAQPVEVSQALAWLDANTPRDSVIVTNGWANDALVRAYTHDLTLTVPYWWTSVTRSERIQRYLVRSAIYDMSPAFFEEVVAKHDEDVQVFKQAVSAGWIEGLDIDILIERQADIPYEAGAYASLYGQPLGHLLNVYHVDYIWVGPWERHAGDRDFARAQEVELVYSNAIVQIYRVR